MAVEFGGWSLFKNLGRWIQFFRGILFFAILVSRKCVQTSVLKHELECFVTVLLISVGFPVNYMLLFLNIVRIGLALGG